LIPTFRANSFIWSAVEQLGFNYLLETQKKSCVNVNLLNPSCLTAPLKLMPTNENMNSEKMTSGFDLSYPLISRPQTIQDSTTATASTRFEATPHEKMTGGFDLSWPLISRRPEDLQEEVDHARKAA
jgi:hypothetical protein